MSSKSQKAHFCLLHYKKETTAAQGESSHWRLAAPESSDSEPELPRQDTTTSGEEQYESADDGNSPPPFPYPVTGASTPTTSSRYRRITGPGPRTLGSPQRSHQQTYLTQGYHQIAKEHKTLISLTHTYKQFLAQNPNHQKYPELQLNPKTRQNQNK